MPSPDLWSLIAGPQLDATALASAIEVAASGEDPDFRTRLLIRDALHALSVHWGPDRTALWLAKSPCRNRLQALQREDLGEPGFASLPGRVVEVKRPHAIEQYLREIGLGLSRSVRLEVGGAIALILSGYLTRHTEDVDVADEVPSDIRSIGRRSSDIAARYGLHLTHFQSYYLPAGYRDRLHYHGSFGRLEVYLVDVYDLFVGKLFSRREKDLDDLRQLAPQLDRARIVELLGRQSAWLQDDKLWPLAEKSWYIIFGEALPRG